MGEGKDLKIFMSLIWKVYRINKIALGLIYCDDVTDQLLFPLDEACLDMAGQGLR